MNFHYKINNSIFFGGGVAIVKQNKPTRQENHKQCVGCGDAEASLQAGSSLSVPAWSQPGTRRESIEVNKSSKLRCSFCPTKDTKEEERESFEVYQKQRMPAK